MGYLPGTTPDGDPAPILLVNQDDIPSATADALADLAPSEVIIVGGTTSVSTGVEEQLGESADVRRIAGDDRYETAALIAVEHGSSLTGPQEAPMLLAKQDSLPSAVAEEILRLSPQGITILVPPTLSPCATSPRGLPSACSSRSSGGRCWWSACSPSSCPVRDWS